MLPASARAGHLTSLLVTLERLTLGKRTDVAKPLRDLAEAIRKRGLVVLISDLLDDPDRVLEGLKHFRYRGTEVIVFQVLDPAELRVPVRAGRALSRRRDDGRSAGGAERRARAVSRGDHRPAGAVPARAAAAPASTT